MSATSTPRSPRFDLPSAPAHSNSNAPEMGLSEWASKIKAMQRQVDADDEAEQRRLEEEIMRARLARMRRSKTGQSGDFGVGMHGIDLSKIQEVSSRNGETELGTSSSEKQSSSNVSLPKSAMKQTPNTGIKAAPVSLATFMGGSATGPRLKRHEPQADPTVVYDGRIDHGPVHPIFGRSGVAMPGMVTREVAAALPSPVLSSISTSLPMPTFPMPTTSTPPTVPSEPSRSRTMSTSNAARRYVEKLEEQNASQPSTPKLSGPGIRELRKSAPHGSFSELPVSTPPMPLRPVSQNLGVRATSPDTRLRGRSPTAAKTPADVRPKTPTASDVRPKTPSAEHRPKTPVVVEARSKPATESRPKTPPEEPRAKTPGADTTQTRTPIQPSPSRSNFSNAAPRHTPRHQSSTQLPSVSTIPPKSPGPPSPVRATHAPQPQRGVSAPFLRPISSSARDLTPSISRLHGRGFVQSIVQASDRLGYDPQGSPSTAPKHIFPSTSPIPPQGGSEVREKGARRGSVLDRWNPVMSGTSNGISSPPLQSSKSPAPTRLHTAHVSTKPSQGQEIASVKTHDTGRSVRSAVSLPAIPKTPLKKSESLPFQGPQDKKLGSSSTMITYIKPTKTGDDPVKPDVDELGVKASEGGVGGGSGTSAANYGGPAGAPGRTKTPRVSASQLPASPGKPLSHPTKERAKKPRKSRTEEGRTAPAEHRLIVPAPSIPGTELDGQGQPSRSAIPATSSLDAPATRTSADAPALTKSKDVTDPQPSTSGKVTDRWTEPTLIGIKSSPSVSAASRPHPNPTGAAAMVGRRALPGLVNHAVLAAAAAEKERDKDEKPVIKEKEKEARTVPTSPTRHSRIPSTGNRALVMEVAQALNEAQQQQQVKEKEATIAPVPAPTPAFPVGATDKRKSYERYSAIAMPPLKEERTPAATPANTMSRTAAQNVLGATVVSESPMSSLRVESAGTSEQPSLPKILGKSESSSKVHIDHIDEPLPKLDVAALLKAERPAQFVPNPDLRSISVEVLSVIYTSVTPVQRDTNVFYDAEVLVIVHRAKSRESGLVVTKVWCWKGRKCHYTEREEKKVGELARRYGTSAEEVLQQREPAGLVHVLGGQLAIRQGIRAHWSSENTAMHVVRSQDGHIMIDEIDLNIKNLCSGYSYCVTILDNIYVWHGCGSVQPERTAALQYAHGMAANGATVVELTEGENDGDDEMFWMVVGESDSYAKADYWRWRTSVVPPEPRCWLVDASNSEAPIRPVPTVVAETVKQESVYIIDCFWEFFILVGKDARAKRSDITLAIKTAIAMGPVVAASKPFSPTVHVLILPTQLPLDMRHAFRDLDESALNGGVVPDHMNILSTAEAVEHLRTSAWDKATLRDHTMLPLGLDSSQVPS